jgi:hypothetical protein
MDRVPRHSDQKWKIDKMRKTFMASVAVAALIAATGFASAQGGMKESPAAASPKSEGAAPANAPAAKAETSTPGAAKTGMPHQAQDKGEHSGVNAQIKPDAKATGEMKADSKAKESDSSSSKEMKNPTAETKSPASDSKSKASESTTPAPTAKSPTAETKSPASDSKTTGNAATTATAAPPAEKQTQIASAIKQEKVEEVTNVNFNISIGTAVPSSVRFYPLPARIVEIYPEWRGYDFIRVHGRYIILRPHTREIVYIIEG